MTTSETVYTDNPPRINGKLSSEHRRSLVVDSAISPVIVAERGYKTAVKRSQLRRLFPEWQRRAPSLWIPIYSPDGVTTSAQIRPDTPRKDAKSKPIKYETPSRSKCILDVHPRNMGAVKDASVPLWVTEGIKKGDALTSRGQCAVSVVGVWNWMRKACGPLSCWEHIHLKGRSVYLAFDSDAMLKPEVQLALERLGKMLTERGAHVKIVYLPGGEGDDKVGVDDFLVAGGTVAQLESLARPFNLADLSRVRVRRVPELEGRLAELRRIGRAMPARRQSEFTSRSVFRACVEVAERYGKVVEDGVRVTVSTRTIAELAAISQAGVSRHLKRLEGEYLRRENREGRERDKAGAFVLFTPRANVNHQNQKTSKSEGFTPGGEGRANAHHKGGRDAEAHPLYSVTPPSDAQMRALPEMRWSTNVRHRETDELGRARYVYEHLRRVGKKSAGVAEYLADNGGSATVAELAEELGTPSEKKRTRDFRRRHIERTLLAPAVVTIAGDVVELTPGWREAIEDARELGGELEAAEDQRTKHRLQREAFRADVTPDPVPEMRDMDDMRQPWSRHPEGCACNECSERFGRVLGEHVKDCRCKECFRERRTGERREVRHLRLVKDPEPEQPASPEPPKRHPLGCECRECIYPKPRYARPYRGAKVNEVAPPAREEVRSHA